MLDHRWGAGSEFVTTACPVLLQEIQEYISQVTKGAKVDDPFEGMSPEEINEYVAKHGTAAAAQ